MKKNLAIFLLALAVIALSGPFSSAYSALMTDYCQNPPLIPQPIEPNILFVLDTSGSMSWCAYNINSTLNGCNTNTTTDSDGSTIFTGYDPNTGYEGYFDPEQFYTSVSGVYQEDPNPGATCTCTCTNWTCRSSNSGGCDPRGTHGCSGTRYACCTAKTCTGACTSLTGNYLNYANMHRIDLLRWAMTGGSPSTCSTAANTPDKCDPELYATYTGSGQVGNTTNGSCYDSLAIDGASKLGGCILKTDSGTQVKVPWNRVKDSLAFKFVDLELRPRMGTMFFNTSGVSNSQLVYIGDATTAATTVDLNFPYKNLITKVNAAGPTGSTPTGLAVWDAYNYFAQNNAQYGGFAPQNSTATRWKNPMYVCDQTGASCTFVPCAGNYVILLSDGQWNQGPSGSSCTIGNSPSCTSASADPVVPAYCMHAGFTNNQAVPATSSKVNATYTVGLFLGGTGITSMKNVAMYGSFDNTTRTWPGGTTGYPAGTCGPVTDCCTTSNCGKGSSCTAVPASSLDWDKDANSLPDTFYSATNALEIKDSIITTILDILQQATSGTAVSILASGEGSGANLLQAFFYPKKSFSDTDINWTGDMQNLWYYLDPKLQVNTIREDTVSDKKLELKDDNVVHFRFDTALNKTRADLYKDVAGDGLSLTYQSTVDLEQTKNLWEAGKVLWLRTPARTIFTTTSSSYPFSKLDFSVTPIDNSVPLRSYLQAATPAEATNIINYINGTDISGYRPRTVTISSYDSTPRVWRLGDIVSSTPKVQSWIRLNGYNLDPPNGYGDDSYQKYLDSLNYKTRGMVYVGANDGMFHAFKLGLPVRPATTTDKFLISQLCDDLNGNGKCDAGETPTNLGEEAWSYIPKNALPYLKYLTDPNYCHLYYVDATPYLFDASINAPSDCAAGDDTCVRKTTFLKDALGKDTRNLDTAKTSWKTIVIGGMGQGGACRKITGGTCATGNCSHTTATSCTVDANCPATEKCLLNCVKTPIMDPADNTKGLGYSSYFALDISNPQSPSLLWEFSEASIPDADKGLGYSTSGPAVVRIGDRDQNGKWYAVFVSGPTGPIDTGLRQFLGKSDQNLRLFVLDLRTGALVRTIDTGLANAFGGSLSNATVDTDRWRPDKVGNYQDDVFYVGYTQWSGTNWVGGVLRVSTKESDPSQWVVSTVINSIGAVTSAVSHLQDRTNHKLWLYFGTGRYFFKQGTDIDDADTQQRIYGVKDPCYDPDTDAFISTCTSPVSGLIDSTTSPPAPDAEPANGWFITLDASGTSYKAERVITNPLAPPTGAVFFSTFAPTADVCGYSGNSFLWAVNYRTGGSAPSSALHGSALIQVSTGEIKEVPLATAFTEKIASGDTQGRRTPAFRGVPPKGQGLAIVVNPRPMKKVLHMMER